MKPIDTINVIPLIDVMLVMLAVVLTTATFINYGQLDVDVPEARSGAGSVSATDRRITIDRDGRLFLDDESVSISMLGARLSVLEPETALALRVDRDARFQHFSDVVDLLKQHNLHQLSIVVRPSR